MGNFERLSVLVIVVVIVMILIVALVQLTNDPGDPSGGKEIAAAAPSGPLASPTPPAAGLQIRPTSPTLATPPATEPSAPGVRVPGDPLRALTDGSTVPPAPANATPETSATPTPVPETPKPQEPKLHVVQSGETIQKIAKVYYPSSVARATDAILKANPTVDASRMRVGTKLVVPPLGTSASVAPAVPDARPSSGTSSSSGVQPGASYTVRSGDTLASIARRAYGRSDRWHEIWIANFDAVGDDVDHPRAGTRLSIPR